MSKSTHNQKHTKQVVRDNILRHVSDSYARYYIGHLEKSMPRSISNARVLKVSYMRRGDSRFIYITCVFRTTTSKVVVEYTDPEKRVAKISWRPTERLQVEVPRGNIVGQYKKVIRYTPYNESTDYLQKFKNEERTRTPRKFGSVPTRTVRPVSKKVKSDNKNHYLLDKDGNWWEFQN